MWDDEKMKINIDAIIKIESDGDPKAFNKHSKARGLCQITPICLEEWNAHQAHRGRFDESDLFSASINKMIAQWYLNERIPAMLIAYALPVSLEFILGAYNFGIGNMKKIWKGEIKWPAETRNYIEKYRSLSN